MNKENKAGKEKIPQTPLKEKGETKESPSLPPRVRENEAKSSVVLPPVINIHQPPTLELLLAFAASRGWTDEAYTRKWFGEMSEELFWCHPVTGLPLNHWPAYFRRCYLDDHAKGEGRSKKGRNGTVCTPRRADNWRGTREEDIGNVLG